MPRITDLPEEQAYANPDDFVAIDGPDGFSRKIPAKRIVPPEIVEEIKDEAVGAAAVQAELAQEAAGQAAEENLEAQQAAIAAQAAAAAAGTIVFETVKDFDLVKDTYADALAALPALPEGQNLAVREDETKGNSQVFYRVEGGALVENLNTDLFVPNFASSAPANRRELHERFITPDMFGNISGGDNSLALLRARDAAFANQCALVLPRGTYTLSETMELGTNTKMVLMPGARLKALEGFSGEALVRVGNTTDSIVDNVTLSGGGILDGSNEVDITLDFACARFSKARELELVGGNIYGVRVGATEAQSRSYEIDMQSVRSFYNDVPNAEESIGFLWENASDCYFNQGQSIGYRKGFRTEGGSIEISQAHPWVRPIHGAMTHAFDIAGSSNTLSQCYADTPTNYGIPSITDLYGFYIGGFGVTLQACRAFMNTNYPGTDISTDGLVDVIHYPAERLGSIFGFRASGATTERRWKSYIGGDATASIIALGLWDEGSNRFTNPDTRNDRLSDRISTTFKSFVDFDGNVNFDGNAVFNGALTAIAQSAIVRGPAGTNRDLEFRTDALSRWNLRVSPAAETGANAGSGLQLNAYNDDGSFLKTILTANRATGRITLSDLLTTPGINIGTYTVATLPNASSFGSGALIRVSDGYGGTMCLAVSNGAQWFAIPIQGTVSTTERGVSRVDAVRPTTYTVATLPSASGFGLGSIIRVSDGDAGVACLAVSDGTQWRRVPIGAAVSTTS